MTGTGTGTVTESRARVAVLGAAGRMGRTVCQAITGADDLELVTAVDPGASGRRLGEVVPLPGAAGRIEVVAQVEDVAPTAPDVLVDFSRAEAAAPALEWCAGHGVHAVSGTTGLAPETVDRLRELFAPAEAPNAVLVPNFAVSAVLLLRLAEIAAAHLDGVEIVELHHDGKRDAPSGTAIETARRIAEARARAGLAERAEPTVREVLHGARGAVAPGGIHVHAVRLPGLVAHEEVVFGGLGQSLTIRQDSYDLVSFMPGVLAAVRRAPELPGLTLGLEAVLGI